MSNVMRGWNCVYMEQGIVSNHVVLLGNDMSLYCCNSQKKKKYFEIKEASLMSPVPRFWISKCYTINQFNSFNLFALIPLFINHITVNGNMFELLSEQAT